jgi:ribosome biogenesis protein MAK21
MLDPGLTTCSKQAMFLNLIYKSLKADIMLRRVKAFVKRLLQVTCTQMPPFICGALYLVSEILKAKPDLRSQLDDHPVCSLLLLDLSGCWCAGWGLLCVCFSLLYRW